MNGHVHEHRGDDANAKRLSEAGLRLHSWPRDRAILPIEDIGHSLAGLVLRFGTPFPGAVPSTPGAGLRKRRVA